MGNSKFVSAVYAPPTMTYCPLMIIVTSWDAYKVDLTMSLYHISCFYSDFRSFHNGLGNQTEGLLTNSIPSSLPNIGFSIIKSFLELGWRSYLVRWQRTRTLSTGIIWKPSRNWKLIFSWQMLWKYVHISQHKQIHSGVMFRILTFVMLFRVNLRCDSGFEHTTKWLLGKSIEPQLSSDAKIIKNNT